MKAFENEGFSENSLNCVFSISYLIQFKIKYELQSFTVNVIHIAG